MRRTRRCWKNTCAMQAWLALPWVNWCRSGRRYRAQIKRLMEQLVQEQRVHLRGVTRGGRWLAGPAIGLVQLAQKSGAAEPNQSEPNRPEL